MITWIMVGRNDGYCGELDGCENFGMRRLRMTVESILAFRFTDEVIVVEWNPPTDRAPVAAYLGGLERPPRIVTVPPIPGLDRLPVYEYVAKHVGATRASDGRLIFCNGDNIFPPENFNGGKIIDKLIVRASRADLDRTYARLPIDHIYREIAADNVTFLRRYPAAAGDYTGITMENYWTLGGYELRHINWHTDNDLIASARAAGYGVLGGYTHYHIDHDYAGKEAPGRSRRFECAEVIRRDLIDRAINEAVEQ